LSIFGFSFSIFSVASERSVAEKILFSFQGDRLIDQHDGDVIFDAINQFAMMAYKLIFRFPVFQLSCASGFSDALRAGQNR
jgi:hypothetical protein